MYFLLMKESQLYNYYSETRKQIFYKTISHFPIENRKASMDCLEGQSKVAENFKS